MNQNYQLMQSFNLKNIPDLDICVLGALEFLSNSKIPALNIKYKTPLIVGSGNAEATGKILFNDCLAIFASESNFEEKLKKIKSIDSVILVSASGGKHAPIIAKTARKYKKKVVLITTNPLAEAIQYSNETIIFPHQREPYTYNTSTYLSMILGKTNESPQKIHKFISSRLKINTNKLKKYNKFYLIIPPEFPELKRMLEIKFIELFGREIAKDIETSEYIKHATTLVPSKELFISFGEENKTFGKKSDRLHIPIPKNADYGTMMSIAYYVIGKIQKCHKPYFKNNLLDYTKKISKVFNQDIQPIVE